MSRKPVWGFIAGFAITLVLTAVIARELLSVIGVSWTPFGRIWGRKDGPPSIEAVAIENVRSILQLNTNSVEDIVVVVTDTTVANGPLQRDRRLVVWSYWDLVARIGFNLEEASLSFNGREHSVMVTLPSPGVTDSLEKTFSYHEYERIGFSEQQVDQLVTQSHRARAFSAFLSSVRTGQVDGALEQAQTRAERMIRVFLQALGYEDSSISIVFREPQRRSENDN
jgi:hypothetical protein